MNDTSTVATEQASGTSRREVAGVDALEHHHPRVPAQAFVELAAAHVHRVDAGGPALEQGLREPSRGRPHVHGHAPARVHAERVQRALELERAPAHVLRTGKDVHHRFRAHGAAGLGGGLAVHAHAAGHDQRLGLLARRGQPALDEPDVKPPRRQRALTPDDRR